MDSVWKEIPDYHSNERMENEGGFETTILNIDILTNLLSIDELFKTRVWEKSRTYLEKRFDGSGFGPEEFGREGNYIKASIRHTALTTYLFGKIISSDECVTSAFNNFYIKGVKKLFLSETEYTIEYGNSIKIDDRSPVLQYFLYWHIVKFLKNKKVIDSIGKQIDINKILEQWDNSELKLQSHLLIDNYEGNSHFEHRYINDLVVPYGNFIKMEVYTFLTSAIFLDEEMPKIVRERYRNGIEYIINDYIKEFGDVDKRYTKDYLRPKIRGIKSHFSKKLQTKYSNNNSVDLGCTALLLRILRTEKILFALWPNDVPKWLPKICFYLNEDLCDNFDRYIISTEIYDVTNAGMLANCLIGDNKELINEILKTQKIYLYEPLGDDKGIISGNMLMKCVKALQQEDEFKAQVSNFSLLALLLEKRPSRFIDVTNFDEWPDYKQISNNESLKSYLTSVAYNDCIEEYTTAHISDERKNTILKIVRTMEDILGGLKNKSIFDVGCGLGDYAVSFYENGSDVTAIDISKKMIKSAKSKNNNIDFQILDMRNIPDNWNSKFDGIICVTAFQHIPIENAAIILKKFHDILKNNGVLRVDIQIGREQGFDPDLRYIETYTDENDAFKKLELKNLGFEKIISKEWKLKKGQNAFKRDIEFHFVELWLKKQQ